MIILQLTEHSRKPEDDVKKCMNHADWMYCRTESLSEITVDNWTDKTQRIILNTKTMIGFIFPRIMISMTREQ